MQFLPSSFSQKWKKRLCMRRRLDTSLWSDGYIDQVLGGTDFSGGIDFFGSIDFFGGIRVAI